MKNTITPLPALLSDYCAVFTEISQWKKKERHQKLQSWLAKDYGPLPNWAEILAFLAHVDGQDVIKITQPFLRKVLFPVADDEMFLRGNAEAMKLLLLRFEIIFFPSRHVKENEINLFYGALKKLPDDQELLAMHWEYLLHGLAYSIHEVPWGVLINMNGASLDDMPVMWRNLEEFETLSVRLGRDPGNIAHACRDFYRLWAEYLAAHPSYANFEAYIDAHKASVSPASIEYIWGKSV